MSRLGVSDGCKPARLVGMGGVSVTGVKRSGQCRGNPRCVQSQIAVALPEQ